MQIKLREIRAQPTVQRGQQGILLTDPLGIGQKTLFVPNSLALLLQLMDGTRDLGTLRTGFELRTGTPLGNSVIEQLLSQFDEALFLENERFSQAYEAAINAYRSASSRPPTLAGTCYPAAAQELDIFLKKYFDQLNDDDLKYPAELRGLISPHIDYERGGSIYAQIWSKAREVLRQAELVVILGTDHNEGQGRITLTHQNYETPYGVIPTAQDVINELANEIGKEAFACELNHRGEHSIEAALVWLHYLIGQNKCHVAPILCGSFQTFIERGESPIKAPHIASTVDTLKKVAEHRLTVFVAAADLAHIGPVFGDSLPVDLVGRARMSKQDEELVSIISRGNAEDFFAQIAKEKDMRHICGLPPIYIALSIMSEATGTLAGYAQCPASNDGSSLVSICGMLFSKIETDK